MVTVTGRGVVPIYILKRGSNYEDSGRFIKVYLRATFFDRCMFDCFFSIDFGSKQTSDGHTHPEDLFFSSMIPGKSSLSTFNSNLSCHGRKRTIAGHSISQNVCSFGSMDLMCIKSSPILPSNTCKVKVCTFPSKGSLSVFSEAYTPRKITCPLKIGPVQKKTNSLPTI